MRVMTRITLIVLAIVVMTILSAKGCRELEPTIEPPPKIEEFTGGTASITGKIVLKGKYRPKQLVMGDDFCENCFIGQGKELPQDEEVVVDANNNLANVLVYVSSGLLEKYYFETPKEVVVLDQVNCIYVPHVTALMVGQAMEIHSQDDVSHNVNSQAKKTRGFNETMVKGQVIETSFAKPELMALFKCDMHTWMSSYVNVMETPFYSVSAKDGSFDLTKDLKLPAGTYKVSARHELLGTSTTQTVHLKDGEAVQLSFTFKLK